MKCLFIMIFNVVFSKIFFTKIYINNFLSNKFNQHNIITQFTPFYISNADFNGIKKIKKHKINSRNFTYDGLTFSCSFLLKQVKDEM